MAEYKLELRGVCKSFPGVKALDNVQLSLRPGTVHALMGENGAGKSTLMKCLFGIYKMDAGEIILDGEKVEINPNWKPGQAFDTSILDNVTRESVEATLVQNGNRLVRNSIDVSV